MPIDAELYERLVDAVPPVVRVRLVWPSDAVRPGVAETVSITVPVKLFRLVKLIVEVPDEGDTRMVCEVGLAEAEKSDTLTVIIIECTNVPFATETVRL